MKFILKKLILTILLYFSLLNCYASSNEFLNNKLELNGTKSNGYSVNVIIEKAIIKPDYPYKKSLLWGGDEIEMPKAVITSISVRINGLKIMLPLSSYSDLGNPTAALLILSEKGFVIEIAGGEAAGAYSAKLILENNLLCFRKITSSEFPDQVWEKTYYSFIPSDKEM